MMEKGTQVQYFVELAIYPGKVDAFKRLAEEAINITLAKSKVLGYQFYFNNDGSKCCLLEQYPDSEALLPHIANLQPIVQKVLAVSRVTRFEVFGNLNPEARKTLSDFGAKIFEYWNGFVR
jgi:quinol monooxygenase YgiN